MLKRILSPLIAILLLFGSGFMVGALSQERFKSITVYYANIKILINGKLITPEVEPFTYQWRAFVPIRFIAEAFDKEVSWDDKTKTIKINDKPSSDPEKQLGEFKIHFIDVGQGDATLIQTPCEMNILVDAGTRSAGSIVVSYLQELGIKK